MKPGPYRWWALGLYLLQMVDMYGTLVNVARGATELNPIWRDMLAQSPMAFVFFKSLVSVVTCSYIFFKARSPFMDKALPFMAGVYGCMAIIHVLSLFA